jgi:hypothetical protein
VSFNVLVVPEDPTLNGYILEPLIDRILRECGKPSARIEVLRNPRAKGYDHAKTLIEGGLLDRYKHMHLILFLPDADGKDRSAAFRSLEATANQAGLTLICECAVQEVEVWLLAGHTEKLEQNWQEVRADLRVKETIFWPFLKRYGDSRRAGGGRDLLMQETLNNYGGLLARCPEVKALQNRICAAVAAKP